MMLLSRLTRRRIIAESALGLDDSGEARALSGAQMREVFCRLASGVVVVTCWVDDRPWGLTINSCCSISTEPSRLVVSLQTHTRTCQVIKNDQRFGLAILGADLRHVAVLAATPGQPKFLDDHCESSRRQDDHPPVVSSAIWHLDCAIHRIVEIGDHSLIVADVLSVAGTAEETSAPEPLLYYDRNYRLIGDQP